MKIKDKLNKVIQNKRAEYLKSIIDDFIESELENKNMQNCFSFVNNKFNKEDFMNLLNQAEKEFIGDNVDNWFSSLTSIDLFKVFITNIEYHKKIK
jgi:hypothetical protein